MKHPEIAIVFPPVTEARFFPYLSLPMITAYLRQQNLSISQTDLNLELCYQLLSPETLAAYIRLLQEQEEPLLEHAYRIELASYLLAHHEELFQVFLEKRHPSEQRHKVEMRLLNLGIEMMLEGSILKQEVPSLEHISEIVETYAEIPLEDFAARLQYEMLEQLLEKERPKIFAISVAYFSQILPSLLLAKWVKQLAPETVVIFGGQQVMIFQEPFAKLACFRNYVDGLGIGAGEETMLKLHQALAGQVGRDEVPDLIWMNSAATVTKPCPSKTKLHIKDLPPPDFDGLPIRKYMSNGFQLALTTCVGCYWGRCVFCSYGNRSRLERSYQQKTARQLAHECLQLMQTYQVRRINFVDENTNLKLVLHSMRILNDQGYHVEFSTRNRLEDALLNKAFCQELRLRGCVLMSAGYETYSQRLLDVLDKGVTSSHYQQIIDNLHEVGIELRLSVMGGIPSETPEEAAMTIEFLQKNEEKIGIDVFEMLVAEPKTYLTLHPEAYGVKLQKNGLLRGNPQLNYGMGRLGFAYDYADGNGYEDRLDWLLRIPHQVNPVKNGLVTAQGAESEVDVETAPGVITGIQLHPWVKVVKSMIDAESPEAVYVLDLLAENVFELAEQVVYQDGRIMLGSTDTGGTGGTVTVGTDDVDAHDVDDVDDENTFDADMQVYLKELVDLKLGMPLLAR